MYKTWIEALFPKAKRAKASKKGGAAAAAPALRKSATSDLKDSALSGNESAGAATGTDKEYDESWIPDHHINRPQARRVKGSYKSKTKAAAE